MLLSNGKTTGANFLHVMPSGVSLLFISNLGVWGSLGSSVEVLSFSESISNESSILSKIPDSRVPLPILHLADLPFYKEYLVCGKVLG